MSRDSKDLIVGLDIGTSKIVALVAELTPEGRVNVIGMGSQESKGLKKGVVVNIEETVATISRVLQEVELMADCKVRDVYTGIAGSHIRSFNSNGMVAIKDNDRAFIATPRSAPSASTESHGSAPAPVTTVGARPAAVPQVAQAELPHQRAQDLSVRTVSKPVPPTNPRLPQVIRPANRNEEVNPPPVIIQRATASPAGSRPPVFVPPTATRNDASPPPVFIQPATTWPSVA